MNLLEIPRSLCLCLSLSLSVSLCLSLSLSVSLCLSISLSVSLCLSVSLPLALSIYLSLSLCLLLSLSLSLSLSVCLSLFLPLILKQSKRGAYYKSVDVYHNAGNLRSPFSRINTLLNFFPENDAQHVEKNFPSWINPIPQLF